MTPSVSNLEFDCGARSVDEVLALSGGKPRLIYRLRDLVNREPVITYIGLDIEELAEDTARSFLSELHGTEQRPQGTGRALSARLPFSGGVFAYLPFHSDNVDAARTSSARYWLIKRFIAVDHLTTSAFDVRIDWTGAGALDRKALEAGTANVVSGSQTLSPRSMRSNDNPSGWMCDTEFKEYENKFRSITNAIAEGKIEQAILSIGFSKTTTAKSLDIFRCLESATKNPYSFWLDAGNFVLLGSSPALHLSASQGSLLMEADAGTRPLSEDEERNQLVERELLSSTKDLLEQQMLVTEVKKCLSHIARNGTVRVTADREPRRMGNLVHIYSEVIGELAGGIAPFDALRITCPSPLVSGAPRMPAVDMIRETETCYRGPYGGIVGLIGRNGYIHTSTIIRSAWMIGSKIFFRSGSGIISTSNAAAEYQECLDKSKLLMESVAAAEAASSIKTRSG